MHEQEIVMRIVLKEKERIRLEEIDGKEDD